MARPRRNAALPVLPPEIQKTEDFPNSSVGHLNTPVSFVFHK